MNITFYGLHSSVKEWRAVVEQETEARCGETYKKGDSWCFDAQLSDAQRNQLHASHWYAIAPGNDMQWNCRIGFEEIGDQS